MIPVECSGCAGIGRGRQDSTDSVGRIVGRNWHQSRDIESDEHRSWDRSTIGVHHESNRTDFFGALPAAGRRTGRTSRIVRSRCRLAVGRQYQTACLDTRPGDCSADRKTAETSSGVKNPASRPGSSTRERIFSYRSSESLPGLLVPWTPRNNHKADSVRTDHEQGCDTSPGA